MRLSRYFVINCIILFLIIMLVLFDKNNLLYGFKLLNNKGTFAVYKTGSLYYDNKSIKLINYPRFNHGRANDVIKEYVYSNLLPLNKKVTYEVNIIDDIYVNIVFYIDSKYHQSITLNVSTGEEINNNVFIKNVDEFNNFANEQLLNKYPKFLVDAVNTLSDCYYDIRSNEMVVYYNNYVSNPVYDKELYIVLNYNDINNLIKFNHILDLDYINQNVFTFNGDDKIVSITFDDGPSGNITLGVLETLKENHATATFFMQGYKIELYPDVARQVIYNGNEAGNHSYSHVYLNKVSEDKFDFQINHTNEIFKTVTGYDMTYIRPPYGSYNDYVKEHVSLPIILWSIDTNDWRHKNDSTVDAIVSNALDGVSDGSIILMHDAYNNSLEALKKILPELYVRGYKVAKISDHSSIKGITLNPNEAYRKIK